MRLDPSARFKRMRSVVYASLVIGVIAYLGREALRKAEPATTARPVVSECQPNRDLAIDDPGRYHHTLTPCDRRVERDFVADGSARSLEYEVAVAVNSLGFRNEEYTVAKPTATTRVILLGDSFVYGLGVKLKDTFFKRLEHELRSGDRNVEVWNIGVVSWATHVQRRVVEGPLLRFSPDLVVLFFDDSDFYGNDAYRRLQGNDHRFPPNDQMQDFWQLRQRVITQAWKDSGAAKNSGATKDPGATNDSGAPKNGGPPPNTGFATFSELQLLAAQHIEAIAARLKRAGVPFLVVTYPYPGFTREYQTEGLKPFFERLEQLGVDTLSLYGLFPARGHERYYFAGNRHWNPEGHKRVAGYLQTELPRRYPQLF